MLPIHSVAPDIVRHLREGRRLVLSAPTGSGKTTQVPQILLRAGVAGGRIVVLQPRRLAARVVAARVAAGMGSPLGQMVGYQTRHDSKVSANTTICFITEGLFVRLLQSDARLPGIGTVILDEFHERSIAADVTLALVKGLQQAARPDLRLVVMSATLDTKLVSQFLGCPTVEAGGRLHPIQMHYLDRAAQAPCWDLAADALSHVLQNSDEGDVLIFMPGAYEIRRTIETCQRACGGAANRDLVFFPLYGELPVAQQDAALAPLIRGRGRRKVIVSTNVAETSITIEGVRHVIDSGLARVHRFDSRRGIDVLLIEPISQDSTQQRAGRAGRTAPGTCTRLWTEREQRSRPAHGTPEIQRLDLADTLLQLLSLGAADPAGFDWLQAPTPAALAQALELLRALNAVGEDGRLTPTGQCMARLPMHPRLSRMLVEAQLRGCLERAVLWAALISERDILIRGGRGSSAAAAPDGGEHSDLDVLERAFNRAKRVDFDPGRCEAMGIHGLACREVERTCRLFLDACGEGGRGARGGRAANDAQWPEMVKCLLVAFPDRVALRRGAGNLSCALPRQRRGELDRQSVVQRVGLLLAVDACEIAAASGGGHSRGGRDARPTRSGSGEVKTVLSIATEVEPEWLEEVHPKQIVRERVAVWNAERKGVDSIDRKVFDGLVYAEASRGEAEPAAAAAMLAERVIQGEIKLEGWEEKVEQWIARVRCCGQWFPERRLIAYDEDERRLIVEEICAGATRTSQVKNRACLPAVRGALSWEDQQFVEKMAPERIELPGGWKMKVEYQPGAHPGARGRAKIQDLYGLSRSPAVAGGKQTVVLEILGPNSRPVQMTEDLAGFWKNLYPVLRKELSRKYPRHEWR